MEPVLHHSATHVTETRELRDGRRASTDANRLRKLIASATIEHRELLSVVRAVASLVEQSVFPAPGDVVRRMDELAEAVLTHVRCSESSDLYLWLPEVSLVASEELSKLRGQHTSLVENVVLLRDACVGAPSVQLHTELSAAIRSLVGTLRLHESRESLALHRSLHEMCQPGSDWL